MSAYFSATETAFSSLNRIRIKNMADKGNKRAELVMKLEDNFDNMLVPDAHRKQHCKYFGNITGDVDVCADSR
ncbi:MAG: DUF21 domain-containing protein [Lachnospiraceae bacterium]